MRTMDINKQVFYHAAYLGKKTMVDEYGNETGEYELLYRQPVKAEANISAAKGETETRQFGENLNYDKVILCDLKTAMNINEYSRLWIDTLPENEESIIPHDYVVKKVARSLNNVSIAVSKVVVNE